eukprot:CAMPEP_0195143288 /NCGR_PEP_ID=MMETSP0448-20130528/166112_1 /TAXON_ID=66468 /ORGANISM="Heterocapsa triquestra, Strain CCMP 448" /LENGTH=154 /DNA_ID=CAMNT_0040181713 /DNA_START=22 /DNA_END=483 /DNA_ORIENTATION=+
MSKYVAWSTVNCGDIRQRCAEMVSATIEWTAKLASELISAVSNCVDGPAFESQLFRCVVDVIDAVDAAFHIARHIEGSLVFCNGDMIMPRLEDLWRVGWDFSFPDLLGSISRRLEYAPGAAQRAPKPPERWTRERAEAYRQAPDMWHPVNFTGQ